MGSKERCVAGDWVEVSYTLLEPADRAEGLPPETAEKPLLAWVKGYAGSDAALGDELVVTTMTGRAVTGVLTEVDPGYHHTFGDSIPELSAVGRDLRARLATYRAEVGS